MPQFELRIKLEKPTHHLAQRIFYTKNSYVPGVKISDWEVNEQPLPYDTDPLCPGNVNHFLSHYKRLGFGQIVPYISETHETLQQIYNKQKPTHPNTTLKPFMNYFSYRDTTSCEKEDNPTHECVADYLTTMQDSYTAPVPFAMKRLEFKNGPFLLNRKVAAEAPELSPHKFYDDCFHKHTGTLGSIKGSRYVSHNPYTAINSDGSVSEKRQVRCYQLDY